MPTSERLAAERAKNAALREKLVYTQVLRAQQQEGSRDVHQHLIRAERRCHQLEQENHKLREAAADAEDARAAVERLRESQHDALTSKLQEAEGHMVKMAQHIQTLEEDLNVIKTNDAKAQQALTDKLQLAVHEKRKAVKHCERILDESRDIVHKRGDLIKQLDDEARSRIQTEMLCGELDKELHVVKRLRGLIEEKAEAEATRRHQAEEALAAARLELQRVTSEERKRYLLLEEDHRHIQRKWAEAETNYEAIYKLQQQEIDHLTKKLSLAHLR